MKFFHLIVRNALRNKLRTGLTVGGTAFLMFVLLFIVTALTEMEAWEGEAAKHDRIAIQHSAGLANPLPIELENFLRSDEVQRHGHQLQKMNWFGGWWQDRQNFFANLAVDHPIHRELWNEQKIPDDVQARWAEVKSGTIVGKALADKFGWKVGQKISLLSNLYPCVPELDIVGFFTVPSDIRQEQQLFFRWDYLDELMNGRKIVGTYWMNARSRADIPRLKEIIDGHTKNSSDPTETVTEKEFAAQFMEMMGSIKFFVTFIVIGVLVIMTLMTANTIAMSARERVREIAVLRTLGFTQRQILSFIVAEALLLSLVGLLVPLTGALLLFNGMKLSPNPAWFPYFFIEPRTIALATGAALFSGLVASAVPAVASAQRKIVDGLRQVV
jgi:putative ABC transport system permease protein